MIGAAVAKPVGIFGKSRGGRGVMTARVARAAIVAITTGGLAVGGCGSSSSPPQWSQLRSVSVMVAEPGIPPPAGLPRTTIFATSSEVAWVSAALNRHHISRAGTPNANRGCTGGTVVTIKVVSAKVGIAPVSLHAYLCAGHQSGDAAGDVSGFLAELQL
jgi:hypothetical protein